jgi:two-component system, sensor histidine kinase and response regulator
MTTILAIEDDTKIRENIQEILELEGFDVLTAANGKIGVQLAQAHHPDLIICDDARTRWLRCLSHIASRSQYA